MATVEQAAELIQSWRDDILLFAQEALNIKPTEQQKAILISFQKKGSFTSVRSGHGTGKTAAMCICALWHTSLFTPSKTIVTAPSFPQLRDGFMPEMALILSKANEWFASQLKLSTDRMVVVGMEELQFMSARTVRPGNESSIQGARSDYTAYLIDEAYGVPEKVFETIVGAASKGGTDYDGRTSEYRLLIAGNPTKNTGFVYDTHNKNIGQWKSIRLNSEESPLVGSDFINKMASYKGTDVYRVRVLGEHPLTSQSTLISRPVLEEAAKRQITSREYEFAPKILGVDTAWMGGDRCVVYLRQGIKLKKLFARAEVQPIEFAGIINKLWEEHKAQACFIDKGGPAAGGVINALELMGRKPVQVGFGDTSLRDDCYLKRMEMAYNLKEWLVNGGVIENDEEFISECADIQYSFNVKGQMVLESKDSMRERFRSPDLFDAAMLTFAFPVNVPSLGQQLRNMAAERESKNYDPFYDIKLQDNTYNPLAF